MSGNTSSIEGGNIKSGKLILVLIALTAMIITGSFTMAVSGTNTGSNVTLTETTSTTSEEVPRVDADARGTNPIRIKADEEVDAIGAEAVGIKVTHNDVAFIQFVGDVGDDVIVTFDIINESGSQLTALVTITSDWGTIASLDEAESDFDLVRLFGPNQWLVHFSATAIDGGSDTMAISVATLEPGVHSIKAHIEVFDP